MGTAIIFFLALTATWYFGIKHSHLIDSAIVAFLWTLFLSLQGFFH